MYQDVPDYKNAFLPIEQRIDDLLERMTLEEKVAQILSIWKSKSDFLSEDGSFVPENAEILKNGLGQVCRPSEITDGENLLPRKNAEFANAMQKFVIQNTRLGIPLIFHEEGLHGEQARGATNFPQAIALACSWDRELATEIYTRVAKEIRNRGGHLVLSPVLDVAREPRWGRVEETFGEDPFLVAEMGLAVMRGFQGAKGKIDNQHVAATAKHFVAHGQPEGGANCAPANYSERTLREVFLYPFERAVKEGNVQAIMACYHEIDGIPGHKNKKMLQDILRQEWGFDGLVISDYFAINQLQELHSVTHSKAESAVAALQAGVDIEFPDPDCYPSIYKLVKDGRIPESLLDQAVRRQLKLKFKLGLFEDPYCDPDAAEKITNCSEHQTLALKAAQKSAVLLKNENDILPLDRESLQRIAVIGPNAKGVHTGGYSDEPREGIDILTGLQNAFGKDHIEYAEGCRLTEGYASWFADVVTPTPPQDNIPRIAEAVEIAKNADLVILCVGDNEQTCREGWGEHHLGDRHDLDLFGSQNDLIDALHTTGKPIIAVVNHGRPLAMNNLLDKADAILDIWYLGQETGTAVAQLLFGSINPSGKLPISYPRSAGHLPVYYNKKPSANRGYLFTDKSPLLPFGYGKSYTTFQYSDLTISPQQGGPGTVPQVSVNVKNTGELLGDEIVQLYIRDVVSRVSRPVMELKDFQRISLQPGEQQTVTFQLSPDKLMYYDEYMERVLEPGEFKIMVGTSSVEYLSVNYKVK